MKTVTENISDRELLELCRSGNNSGYSLLYRRHAKTVFNSIFRLVNDRQEAEDILQEVFVKAFSEITTLKNADSFGGWTKQIAINHSLSFLRKKKNYFSEIEEDQLPDHHEDDLEEKRKWEFQIEELQNAVAELPVQVRTIVNLFLFEEMPQEEIGAVLGIPASTVRSHYHRAKKKIFEKLTQKNHNERSA